MKLSAHVIALGLSLVFATGIPTNALRLKNSFSPVGSANVDPASEPGSFLEEAYTFYGPPLLIPTVSFSDLKQATDTSGTVTEDHSLFAHPSVYKIDEDGIRTMVDQLSSTVTYQWDRGVATAFPEGFRMIGGKDPELSETEVKCDESTTCKGNGCASSDTFFPTEACDVLEVIMKFPSCWDGENSDSEDHMSHVDYPTISGCPSTYSHNLPMIEMTLRIDDYEGGDYEFSDGSQFFHADFISGWETELLQFVLDVCSNSGGTDSMDCILDLSPSSDDDDRKMLRRRTA